MSSTAARPLTLSAIAMAEVGVREEGGNNRGARVAEYQAATWLDNPKTPRNEAEGSAWCAAFIDYVIMKWLYQLPQKMLIQVCKGLPADEWRPRTAGAFDLENWAVSRGLPVLPPHGRVVPDDLVIFTMSHCGIVVEPSLTREIHTVEGNTSAAGGRDSLTGDGVFAKRRPRSMVKCFIRMPQPKLE